MVMLNSNFFPIFSFNFITWLPPFRSELPRQNQNGTRHLSGKRVPILVLDTPASSITVKTAFSLTALKNFSLLSCHAATPRAEQDQNQSISPVLRLLPSLVMHTGYDLSHTYRRPKPYQTVLAPH